MFLTCKLRNLFTKSNSAVVKQTNFMMVDSRILEKGNEADTLPVIPDCKKLEILPISLWLFWPCLHSFHSIIQHMLRQNFFFFFSFFPIFTMHSLLCFSHGINVVQPLLYITCYISWIFLCKLIPKVLPMLEIWVISSQLCSNQMKSHLFQQEIRPGMWAFRCSSGSVNKWAVEQVYES